MKIDGACIYSVRLITYRSLFFHNLYGPYMKISQFLFVQYRYIEIAVVLTIHFGRRPILYAHHLRDKIYMYGSSDSFEKIIYVRGI